VAGPHELKKRKNIVKKISKELASVAKGFNTSLKACEGFIIMIDKERGNQEAIQKSIQKEYADLSSAGQNLKAAQTKHTEMIQINNQYQDLLKKEDQELKKLQQEEGFEERELRGELEALRQLGAKFEALEATFNTYVKSPHSVREIDVIIRNVDTCIQSAKRILAYQGWAEKVEQRKNQYSEQFEKYEKSRKELDKLLGVNS